MGVVIGMKVILPVKTGFICVGSGAELTPIWPNAGSAGDVSEFFGDAGFEDDRCGTDLRQRWSDDLIVWNVLSDGSAPVVIDASTGSSTDFAVALDPGANRRFYRIELLP